MLQFNTETIDESIITSVSRKLDLDINILFARITPRQKGVMLISLDDKTVSHDSIYKSFSSLGVVINNV